MTMQSTLSLNSRFWNFFMAPPEKPREDERIGAQARKDAERAVGRRCPFFVIDDETKRLPIGQGAGAALDRPLAWPHHAQARRTGKKSVSPGSLVSNLVASPMPATFARRTTIAVIDRIGEDRVHAAGWKDIRGQHRTRRIFRAREREQVREIG